MNCSPENKKTNSEISILQKNSCIAAYKNDPIKMTNTGMSDFFFLFVDITVLSEQ